MSTLKITRDQSEKTTIVVGEVPYSFLCIHLHSNGSYLVEGVGLEHLRGNIEPNLPIKQSVKQLLAKFKENWLYLMNIEDELTEALENFANSNTPFEF